MLNRKLSLILLLSSFFIIIGSVSAAENTTGNASTYIGDNAVDVSHVGQKNVEINCSDLQSTGINLSEGGDLVLAGNPENKMDNITENHNISSAADLEHALNTGGNYTLVENITINGDISKSGGSDVCINGNGHTIRGDDSKYRDINVEKNCVSFVNCVFDKVRIDASSDVSLYNCTIQNTRAGYYRDGAAISAKGCKVIMANCSIVNCGSEDGYHGAVYLKDCRVNITNSYFENCFGVNSATDFDDGGAIFSKSTTLDLSNCVFKNCYARDDGGAVYTLDGNNRIFNCSFIECYVTFSFYGGAIYVKGPTSIINCNFTNCYAEKSQESRWNGAIDHYSHDIYFKVVNCSINGKNYDTSLIYNIDDLNNAFDLGGNYTLADNIRIWDMTESGDGDVCINGNGHMIVGRMYLRDINVEKNHVCFMNCVFDNVRIDASSDVYLYNCTMKNARAERGMKGVVITAEGCKLVMANCSIVNSGSNCGYHGAIYLKDCRANITNNCFEGCFGANSASCDDEGGVIFSKDTTLDLSSCVFKNCYARDDGGAVCTFGGNNRIFNCSFIKCHADSSGLLSSYGGAVYVKGPTSIINCNFTNCSATGQIESRWKGAIDHDSYDIYFEVVNCSINGENYNSSLIYNADDLKNALAIGGNYTLAKNITISGVSKSGGADVCINGNGYTIRGDDSKYRDIDVEKSHACFMNCVFYKVRIDASGDVSLYNCTFKDLRTGKYRYGAAISAEGCKVIMNNCSIINCGSHEGYHGAVYLKDCRATITNSYFENCFAADSWTCDDEGGAIFSKKSTLDLSNSVFKNCYARDDGGAVCTIDGNNKIFNCSFIECHADSSSYGGAVYAEGSTSVTDCNFTNCRATGYKEDTWKRAIDRDDSDIDLKVNNCYINGVLV